MAECGLFETLGRWWFLMPKRVASAPARADPAIPRSKSPDHVGEWRPPFNLRTGRLLTRERQPETRVARRILAFEPVPIGEFKALVKGDGGLVVYSLGARTGPSPGVPRRYSGLSASIPRARFRSERPGLGRPNSRARGSSRDRWLTRMRIGSRAPCTRRGTLPATAPASRRSTPPSPPRTGAPRFGTPGCSAGGSAARATGSFRAGSGCERSFALALAS